jgi:hypothetical protein
MFKFYNLLIIQFCLVSFICVIKGASIGASSNSDDENLLPNGNLAFDGENNIQLINGRPYLVMRQLLPILLAHKKPISDIVRDEFDGNQMEKRAFKLLRVGK